MTTTNHEAQALNAYAARVLDAEQRNGNMLAAADAALPNVQDVLDKFDGARLSYKLAKAVLGVVEFPTLRGYVRASRDAEFAAQRALREAEDAAIASGFDYDEEEIVGETRNEGEIEADNRSDRTLPDFPHEVALGSYLWLRRAVNNASASIPAKEAQYYPALRPLPVTALGVAQYQSAAQKARAEEESAAKAAAAAELTPAQQKATLAAAARKLERAEAWHAKVNDADSQASVVAAKQRLARLSGNEPAPAAGAAQPSDGVRIAVQDFLNAAKAEGAHAFELEDWLALPIYTQHACWEAVSDVLALELESRNRGRLTQLFNEDDAQYLQRANERDALQAASIDAAEWVETFAGHWQVTEMAALRSGSR